MEIARKLCIADKGVDPVDRDTGRLLCQVSLHFRSLWSHHAHYCIPPPLLHRSEEGREALLSSGLSHKEQHRYRALLVGLICYLNNPNRIRQLKDRVGRDDLREDFGGSPCVGDDQVAGSRKELREPGKNTG